jgi:hypothetical protein
VIALLLLEALLDDVAHAELRECGQDVRLGRGAAGEQVADILARQRARRHSPLGLGLSSVDSTVTELKAASHLQERKDVTSVRSSNGQRRPSVAKQAAQ